jgi:hypothetical protein
MTCMSSNSPTKLRYEQELELVKAPVVTRLDCASQSSLRELIVLHCLDADSLTFCSLQFPAPGRDLIWKPTAHFIHPLPLSPGGIESRSITHGAFRSCTEIAFRPWCHSDTHVRLIRPQLGRTSSFTLQAWGGAATNYLPPRSRLSDNFFLHSLCYTSLKPHVPVSCQTQLLP